MTKLDKLKQYLKDGKFVSMAEKRRLEQHIKQLEENLNKGKKDEDPVL